MFAKMTVDQGRSPGLDKWAYHDAIVKRAGEIRRPGETAEKAFTRAITEDDDGKLLFKALKIAPGNEVKDAPQDDVSRVDTRGPAEKEMQDAVENHRAASAAQGLTLSPEQGFTAVYTSPAHRGLKARYDAETLAKRARAG
jgi:hypothetical protein